MDVFRQALAFQVSPSDAFALTLIASGMLTCFFGYRLFKIVLGVTGFVAGGALAWTALTAAGYGSTVTTAGALLVGILAGMAMFSLFFVGVFLFGCAVGLLMAVVIPGAVGIELNAVVVAICALITGGGALWFRKALIVVSTAMTGSWSLLSGLAYFVGDLDLVRALSRPDLMRPPGGVYSAVLVLWLLLGLCGMGVQMSRKNPGAHS